MKRIIIILIVLSIQHANIFAQKAVNDSEPGSLGMQLYRVAFRDIVMKENAAKIDENVYREYLEKFPASPLKEQVQLKMGVFYQERGLYDEALAIFEYLINSEKIEWKDKAKLHSAQVIKQKGMYENAVNEFERIVKETTDPQVAADGLLNLGRLYSEINELSDAEQAYLRLTKEFANSNVGDQAMLEYANLKVRQGDESGSKELFEKMLQMYPSSSMVPIAYESLAEIQLREGDLTNALANIIRGLDANVDPEFEANLLNRKGQILLQMGKYDEAVQTYNQFLYEYGKIGYKDEALLGLSITFREQGNFDQMRLQFEELENMLGNAEELSFNLFVKDSVTLRFSEEKPMALVTLSGARMDLSAMSVPLGADLTLRSIPTPENLQALPLLGKLYEVTSTASFYTPIRVSLPFEETSVRETGGTGTYKIYQYRNDQWQELPNTEVDVQRRLVQATLTNPGTLAIMYETPVIISFRDIFFGFNSIELTPAAIAQLDTVVRLMKQFKDIEIEIAGHTDNVGTDEANLELSQRRAVVIQEHLSSRSISSTRITPRGYGERFPIASNDTEDGRSRNRRTEFMVVSGIKGVTINADIIKHQYSIQIGNFPYPTQAMERKNIISRLQYQTEVIKRREGNQTNYLVWLGKFRNREHAEQVLLHLKNEYKGYPYQIVERW